MTNPLVEAFDQIRQFADPNTIKRLRAANAVSMKAPLAFAKALPWLLGRGPSLGVISQMNSVVVGSKTAIYDAQGSITWRELDLTVNQAAHVLRGQGLRGGDRVATLLRNGREIAQVCLGAQRIGVIACPLNTWGKPKEVAATLKQADPGVLVYDTRHAEQLEKANLDGIALLHVGDDEEALEGSRSLNRLISEANDYAPTPFTRDRGSAKVVIHTSGTTGTPKGAARNAASTGIGALANLLAVVPYSRDDIVYCPAPLFHSFGLATFTFATALGASMVLPDKFDPELSLHDIERYRATAASFVPVMIKRIVSLDDDVKKKYDLSTLRVVLASGSAMSPELRQAAMELFGEVLYDLYGSTEIGWAAIADPDAMKHHPKTVGKPVRGIEIAVFDPEGNELGPNETGELYIRSDILFEGYTSGEDTKEQRDGYMSIGDLGHLDEEGYLFIEGRADDMVVIGGENVYPIEVEEVIEGISGVKEAAVLGVTDEEYGEVLAAFVVGDVSEDNIVKACKADLASYKVPRRVEILDELPRTSTGKILKRELIEDLDGAEALDA